MTMSYCSSGTNSSKAARANPVSELAHRVQITQLESAMLSERECFDPDYFTKHHFCNGAYVREFLLPKGFTVTGKIHRYACINILLSGKIQIVQGDGLDTIMEAPMIYKSRAGEKKALHALEDAVFLNVHALPQDMLDADELDLEEMEAHFIVSSFEQLDIERREALEGS